MEEFVKHIRETYRKEFNVIEVNDLPLVLLTEVINQSILRGATRLRVGFDGQVLFVGDDAKPYEDDDILWILTPHAEGMMSPERRRMFRILDRQWTTPPYAIVNALCTEFKLIASKGEHFHCVICKDGIVVSDNITDVGVGDGNLVFMTPFIEPSMDDADVMEEMMELISERFPQVKIDFKKKL